VVGRVRIPRNQGLLVVAAALCVSCGSVVPPPSAAPASASAALTVDSPAPALSPAASPTEAVASPPGPTPSASPLATPPYTVLEGGVSVAQERGTILFGYPEQGRTPTWIAPFRTSTRSDLTHEAVVAFGAFWGQPVGASRIRVSLYRVTGGTLRLVWSVEKLVKPSATGYLDELVPFKRSGTYRLEVTHGSMLLAWGLAVLHEPCGETNCSGG
jgi:hypothetical protein